MPQDPNNPLSLDSLIKQGKSGGNPIVPNGGNLNPYIDANYVGNYKTGPFPSKNGTDVANNIFNMLHNGDQAFGDPFKWARTYSYGANENGANFDRYYAHPKFKKLGFSPYRDNEAVYNQNSSWWDDFQRTSSVGTNFALKTMFNVSPLNWSQWSAEGDKKAAKDYNSAMGKMMSTRGGTMGWVNNLAANSAYTVGIIGEMALEELILAGITAGTAGEAAPATGTLGAIRAGVGIRRIAQAWKMGKSTLQAFKQMGNIEKSREVFNAFKTVGKSGANFLNPLTGTTNFVRDLAKGSNGLDKINDFSKLRRGFGEFYRDIRELNLVFDESKLEGGMVENEMQQKMVREFYDKNGRMPDGNEAEAIYNTAKSAGSMTTLANIPTIFVSNKVVFGTALRGWKPGFMIRKELEEGLSSPLIRGADRTFKTLEQKGFKKLFVKDYWKTVPRNLAAGSMRYLSANVMEGMQELSQETISATMKDYYDRVYNDPHLAGNTQLWGSFKKGVEDQNSGQGLDVFMSGFLMGGLVQGPQKLLFNKVPEAFYKYKNKEDFESRKQVKQEWTNKVVESLNDVTLNKGVYAEYINRNFVDQKESSQRMEESVGENNKKSFHDAKDDSMFSHIYTLLKSGKYDYFTDSLKDMQKMTQEELQEAFPGEEGDLQTRVQGAIDKAQTIKKKFDYIEEKYRNPFNPTMINQSKDPAGYENERINHNAFEFAKKMAIYGDYNYTRTLERMNSVAAEIVKDKPLAKASALDFSLLFDDNEMTRELKNLAEEVKLFKDSDKREANKKADKFEHLADLLDKKKNLAALLGDKKRSEFSEDASKYVQLRGQFAPNVPVEFTTKDGSKITGTVKKVSTDKNGRPRATIVTKSGTKTVSLANLKRTDVTEKSLEDYDILQDHMDQLYDAYNRYLLHLADSSNDLVLQEALDNSFNNYLDYIELDNDSKDYAKIVNILHNPDRFVDLGRRAAEAMAKAEENRKENQGKALEGFLKMKDQNDLLNELFGLGVYVTPEDAEAFIEKGEFPDHFFDATTNSEITSDQPKYQEIIDLFNKYKESTGNIVETPEGEEPSAPAPTVSTATVAIKPTDPIGSMPKDLVDMLQKAFDQENEMRESEGEKPLSSTDGWQTYVQQNMIAYQIIQNYNKAKGLIDQGTTTLDAVPQFDNDDLEEAEDQEKLIAPQYQGKIIYATPGAGKTALAQNDPNIVDSDDILAEELRKVPGFEEVTGDDVGQQIYSLFKTNGDQADQIYDTVLGKLKQLAKEGKTVLTGSIRYIPQADVVFSSPDNTSLAKQLSRRGQNPEDRIDRIRKAEAMSDKRIVLANSLEDVIYGTAPAITTEAPSDMESMSKKIKDQLEAVETLQDLEKFEADMIELLMDTQRAINLGVNSETIEAMINEKRAEITESLDFNTIKVDDILVMKDKARFKNKGLAKVIEKTASELKVRPIGEEDGALRIVSKNQLKAEVELVYNDTFETQESTEVITPEDKETAKANLEVNRELTAEDYKKTFDESDSQSQEDVDDEFKDSIGKNCKE